MHIIIGLGLLLVGSLILNVFLIGTLIGQMFS